MTEAVALTTHFCYDPVSNDLRTVVSPKAQADTTVCSRAIADVSQPAPVDFSSRTDYDRAHRPVASADPLGRRQLVSYDANSNVVASTNQNGDTTRFSYDQRNLPTVTVSPFMAGHDLTSTVVYDPVGNVAATVSPRASDSQPGQAVPADFVTRYVYDADNRLVRQDLPTGAGAGAAYMHRAYDPNGRLAWASVAVGSANPAQVTEDQKTQLSYWDPGWIRTSKDPANPSVSFDYNARGQQVSRTTTNQGPSSWEFWPDGLLKSRSNPAGSPASYRYDPDGNLVGASATPSEPTFTSDVAMDLEARYDSLDRPTLVRHQLRDQPTWTVSSSAYDLNSNVSAAPRTGLRTQPGPSFPGAGSASSPTTRRMSWWR